MFPVNTTTTIITTSALPPPPRQLLLPCSTKATALLLLVTPQPSTAAVSMTTNTSPVVKYYYSGCYASTSTTNVLAHCHHHHAHRTDPSDQPPTLSIFHPDIQPSPTGRLCARLSGGCAHAWPELSMPATFDPQCVSHHQRCSPRVGEKPNKTRAFTPSLLRFPFLHPVIHSRLTFLLKLGSITTLL